MSYDLPPPSSSGQLHLLLLFISYFGGVVSPPPYQKYLPSQTFSSVLLLLDMSGKSGVWVGMASATRT